MSRNRLSMITPVILSGGSGKRLWPISTSDNPKQFVAVTDNTILIQKTIRRCRGESFSDAVIVAGVNHRKHIENKLDYLKKTVILEPFGRNSLAAIVAAAIHLRESAKAGNVGGDQYMLIMPSDHIIGDEISFCDKVVKALEMAEEGKIVTFGITPSGVHSGYGYLLRGNRVKNGYNLASFVEKPNVMVAKTLIEAGGLWNSGIFMASVETILNEVFLYSQDTYYHCLAAYLSAQKDGT